MDITHFDLDLRERIRLAAAGATILVETDGQLSQAERLLRFYGRDDLTPRPQGERLAYAEVAHRLFEGEGGTAGE